MTISTPRGSEPGSIEFERPRPSAPEPKTSDLGSIKQDKPSETSKTSRIKPELVEEDENIKQEDIRRLKDGAA